MGNIKEITKTIDGLTYEEKKDLYSSTFSIGNLVSNNVNDKLILISLVSLMYLKLKVKTPDITPLAILIQITKCKDDNTYFKQMLESLSILVEEFTYDCNKADSCGLATSTEIINKIKEILNTWIPF